MGFEADGITPIIGLVPVFFCKLSASANVMLYGLRQSLAIFFLKSSNEYNNYTKVEIFLGNRYLSFRVPDFKSEVNQTIQRLCLPSNWTLIFSDISSANDSLETNDYSRRHNSSGIAAENRKFDASCSNISHLISQ